MILINPASDNPSPLKALEPPIWCAMLAKEGDRIVDFEVQKSGDILGDVLIVVMGSNPSASSTPKMVQAEQLYRELSTLNKVFITGLHPMATGSATYQLPPPSELIKIPRARWELLDMPKYRAHNWHCLGRDRSHYAAIYTSFGCPFNCSYCNIHAIYKNRTVYYRAPEDVIAEIGFLVKEYGIKNLKICDELFTLNHKHVTAICSGIKDYNLNIWAYARVGTVTPNLLKTMKEAGVNWLCYGFESADDGVRKQSNKLYSDTEKTIDMTRDSGISILANYVFGLPGDDEDSMNWTLETAIRENFEYVNFYVALPYPGSEWYANLKEKTSNWASYSQFSPDICADPKIVKFRDDAFKTYFNRPEYLDMIEDKFGAKSDIQDMMGHVIMRG